MVLAPAIPPGFGLLIRYLQDSGQLPDPTRHDVPCPFCGSAEHGTRRGQVRKTARRAFAVPTRAKKPRKVSKYQRAFGACLKDLKRQHPRTPTTRLMKRAHACARKKKKQGGW